MKMSNNIEEYFKSRCSNHEMHEGRNLLPCICERLDKIRSRNKIRNVISGIAASILLITSVYFGYNSFQTEFTIKNTLAQDDNQQVNTPKVTNAVTLTNEIEASNTIKQVEVGSIINESVTVLGKYRGQVIILPDQSRISLEKGSSISYHPQFGIDNRKITFSGIAYFEITPDKNKPFIIETNNSITKVVGTAFNLVAIAGMPDQISVTSGIVEFGDSQSKIKTRIVKGQKAEIIASEVKVERIRNNNFMSWKTGSLVFEETPLKEIIPVVKQYFEKDLILQNPALQNCTFSGQFEKPELKDFLDVLSLSLNIEYKIKGKKVILTGAGCGK